MKAKKEVEKSRSWGKKITKNYHRYHEGKKITSVIVCTVWFCLDKSLYEALILDFFFFFFCQQNLAVPQGGSKKLLIATISVPVYVNSKYIYCPNVELMQILNLFHLL